MLTGLGRIAAISRVGELLRAERLCMPYLLRCCEPTPEERSAGNPHATFCGSRGRVTASGDPVGAG